MHIGMSVFLVIVLLIIPLLAIAHRSLEVRIHFLTEQIVISPNQGAQYLKRGELHRHHSDWEAAEEGFVWRRVDRVVVKGKSEAVDIYELLGDAGQVPEEMLRFAKTYEAVLDLFQDGDFSAAHTAAIELGDERPEGQSATQKTFRI